MARLLAYFICFEFGGVRVYLGGNACGTELAEDVQGIDFVFAAKVHEHGCGVFGWLHWDPLTKKSSHHIK